LKVSLPCFNLYRSHLDRALRIFERTWDAVPRIARSTFLLGEVLEQMGEHEKAGDARLRAAKLRDSITTFSPVKSETMEAYDLLVNSWFR
jgi:lipopolysaccharide biosynthesis regulator YciM